MMTILIVMFAVLSVMSTGLSVYIMRSSVSDYRRRAIGTGGLVGVVLVVIGTITMLVSVALLVAASWA
ncbi:hypothetical protein P7L78_22065 [Tistrella bauzanensis]|uniref:hypothetical protein n=1 Tax=Tistrella TaxID=171436 RepID=UPI0031F60591